MEPNSPTTGTYVIVGASLAGAKAAETLREEGFAGRVVLVGDDPERPYERPPLSKGFLLGKDPKDAAYVHEESWYADNNVELLRGVAVERIDAAAREVQLAGGDRLGYDRLLITTGASPRRLNVPGTDLDGVFYLRTMANSAALQAAIRGGDARVVVVGAGWIGLETAAAAREYGNQVTVVEPAQTPLYYALGPELGSVFGELHRRHGVDLRLEEGVTELRGAAGRVSSVVTSSGAELPADVVIIGVGARPNTELAEAAGLDVDNGVLVDQSLCTANPDIYAAGDVANADNPLLGRRIRVEHWQNALDSGPAAARAMLGQQVVYDPVPYFYSDQYDLGMEAAGVADPGTYDEVVYRGSDPADFVAGKADGVEFIAFWLSGGRVVAGMNVNVWDVSPDIQALIRSGVAVDKARLTDPEVPLSSLV